MDETEFRNTYKQINPNRCIFEKSITNRRCDCQLKHKFVLATRECIACQSTVALDRCTRILNAIRDNSRFALKVVSIDGPMPHNKELQVQAGGMLALQSIFNHEKESKDKTIDKNTDKRIDQQSVSNIDQTMEATLTRYQSIDRLPYGEIVKGIVKYQTRPKRSKKK